MALWAMVDVDMPTDEKLFGQPVSTRHLWTCLICLAKRQDHEGAILGYDCALLAGRFNVPRKAVAAALTHFQSAKMVELDPDGTIRLINFAKRQGPRDTSPERSGRYYASNREIILEKRRVSRHESNGVLTDGITAVSRETVSLEGEEEEKEEKKEQRARDKHAPATALQAFLSGEWNIRNPGEYEKRMLEAFPGLDLLAEAKKALGYQKANPQKHYKNHGRYFYGWLGNAQRFAAESQPDAMETERASARASRDAAKTRADITKLESVVPEAPSPEVQAKLKALMKGIGT